MLQNIKLKIYNFLKWTEKWTKTDMVYLARGGVWITTGKIIGMITGFLLSVIYANFVPQEEYATYKYLLSIAGLFAITTLPGIETSLIKSIAQGHEGSFKPAIKTRLKWSLGGIAIALIVSMYYYFQKNTTLSLGFFIIAITTPIINSINIGPFIQGKKLWKYSTIYNSLKNIVIFVFISITAFFYHRAIPLLIAGYLGTIIIQVFFFFLTIEKYKPNKKEDKQCISLGKHLSLMSVLGTIAEHIDKILIWKFLGAKELAIYSFAIIPVNQMRDFLKSSSILAFPKIAQQDIKILKKTLPIKIIKFIAILLVPISLYILFAPLLFKILFPKYMDAVKYSQLFSLGLLFFPQRLINHVLVSANKTKNLYLINIFAPLFKISAYMILIPLYHIYGAIISALLSSLGFLFLLIYFFKKIE